jgi:hypothetical protein
MVLLVCITPNPLWILVLLALLTPLVCLLVFETTIRTIDHLLLIIIVCRNWVLLV